ncbi:hypothetical protein BDR06DRAFT_976615 [Suillus hirtellus]|nr:hypothetical protein BDR06DRAFT_976615 [Suillus hirtellus]
MTHYQQEDQNIITTTWKLIVIDIITVDGWLIKVKKAILHSTIRQCINQGNVKHNRKTTGNIIALVSQELSTVCGQLAMISEAHTHHYVLWPEISILDEDNQQYMEHQQSVLYNTSWANYPNYFLHYHNPKTGKLVLFRQPAIRGTHLDGWYNNLLSLIYNESYRHKITTMPRMHAYAVSSIGSMYAHVEQGIYDAFVAAKRMHPEMMEKSMYDLHQEDLDDLSADHNSLCPEEAPSPGPLNYLCLEVPSPGPSTSSYPHFDQPPPLLFPQMKHLKTPYPDMPGRYTPAVHFPPLHYNSLDPCQQPPVKDEVLVDPYYYPQNQGTQPSYLQPPMLGEYSTTSMGEDVLEGFGKFKNFAPGSWNGLYY